MSDLRLWPILIMGGALLQMASFIPALRRARLRSWLIACGGILTLYAAGTEQDHQLLVCQLAVWVWLWRGVVRSRA